MEDKRITKSKQRIKSTLIDILQEIQFEKITVTEICTRGGISRITFYTHYDDKYALAEEMLSDYVAEANNNYHNLQNINNTNNNAVKGYLNLLDAILQLYYENYNFFEHTTAQKNPYLYSLFFNKVFASVDDYLKRHKGVVPQFPTKQTAALLCNSMFGVISSCISDNMPESDVREMVHEIYKRILKSELFHTVDNL